VSATEKKVEKAEAAEAKAVAKANLAAAEGAEETPEAAEAKAAKLEVNAAVVEDRAAKEHVPHIVEWKGESIDLRGFTEVKLWQEDSRVNPNVRIQKCQLYPPRRDSFINVRDINEAREFQALCGPYFGTVHL